MNLNVPAGELRFDPVEWSTLLAQPARVEMPLAWAGHIPFAMLLVALLKPRRLVELGTHSGNSYNAFCQAVDHLGLACRCHAVDTWQGDPQAGEYGPEIYEALRLHQESRYSRFSTLLRMPFDEAAARFEPDSIDLLHIDGLHTYEAVQHDFETWLPKLSDRAVVLFHDTAVRREEFGVRKFWQELGGRYPSLEFPHCHGLGVLGVGRNVPPALLRLIDLKGAARGNFLALIEQLGNRVIVERELRERESEIKRLEAALAQQTREREIETRQLEERTRGLASQLRAAHQEIDTYRGRLAAAEVSLGAIFASRSWRLSRPLRAASRISRRGARWALHFAARLYTILRPGKR